MMQEYLKMLNKSPAKNSIRKESYDWSKNLPKDKRYFAKEPTGNKNRYRRPIQKPGTVVKHYLSYYKQT